MSLLCRLGRHRPRGIPRWNDGLYFARCERCGRDLVRTAFEGWHVPKGYKVVWSASPPAGRPDVALVEGESPQAPREAEPEREAGPAAAASPPAAPADPPRASAAPSRAMEPPPPAQEPPGDPAVADGAPPDRTPDHAAGSQGVRLPIQDVLAHLNAQDAADRAREAPPAPAEAPVRPRRPTWDFMDEDPLDDLPASGAERARADAIAPPAEPAAPVGREVEAGSPTPGRSGGRPSEIRSAVRNFWSGPDEPRPVLVAALALALAVAVALALYSLGYPAPGSLRTSGGESEMAGGGPEGPQTGGQPDPFATSAPYVAPGQAGATEGRGAVVGSASGEVAYVAASLLICRAAPVPQAPRVRNLVRGREVRVLGYDGAWASLDYRGGQCWAQAQYLSPVPPV